MFSFMVDVPLIIFDLAQNHMGLVQNGKTIINAIYAVCKDFPFQFAFKLQYRDLDTLIHPDYKNDMSFKYIKRFSETRLNEPDLRVLKDEMQELGFMTVCTPFDEKSVDLIEQHDFDIIKVASCSFTDWQLLERMALTDKPIIASTAGASLEDIGKVVSFLEHRNKEFALMHCVAEYPTNKDHLQLDRITLLKEKFPNIKIGYSTHENPDNCEAVKVAIGKGATIFEKHVGIKQRNAYSADPLQIKLWLMAIQESYDMCKIRDNTNEVKELKALRRGAYAKKLIPNGKRIYQDDVFFAMPTLEGQYTANDFSKYSEFYALSNIQQNAKLDNLCVAKSDTREEVYGIIKRVRKLVAESGVVVPRKVDVEISHHYGLKEFPKYGMTIFNIVNREYCKKLLVLLPEQKHPEQYHKLKTETYHVLYGSVIVQHNEHIKEYNQGDIVNINTGVKHSMKANNGGCVIEEISTTHYIDDSYYTDEAIGKNMNRKTKITYWMD